MPSIYTAFVEQLKGYIADEPEGRLVAAPGAAIDVSREQRQALARSPAGRVLAGVAQGTIGEFYRSFIDVYTDGQFRWVGSQSISPTRVMETLDGDRTSGECAILAKAFWLLWAAPPPFGLGRGGMSCITFNNNNGADGFISPHPPGGIRGLGPNIIHPHGGQGDPRNCLYSWGDHKILRYNGLYYDPTYRATYQHTDEMVAFAYTAEDPRIIGPDSVTQVRVVTANPGRGWRAGDLMYLRTPAALPIGLYGPYRAIAGWV